MVRALARTQWEAHREGPFGCKVARGARSRYSPPRAESDNTISRVDKPVLRVTLTGQDA